MRIDQYIDYINQRLTIMANYADWSAGINALARPFPDPQQNGKPALQLVSTADAEPTRLAVNSDLAFQSVHLATGVTQVSARQWGTTYEYIYEVNMVLTAVSTSPVGLAFLLDSLMGVGFIRIDGVASDTMDVLKRYWFTTDADPACRAYAVRYCIEHVDQEAMTALDRDDVQAGFPLFPVDETKVQRLHPITGNPVPFPIIYDSQA